MEQVLASRLMQRAADGTVTSIDVLAWEQLNNPDASAEYGFRDLAPDCLALIPSDLLPFVGPHGGAIDTHVYGSLMLKDVTYVADAGANAVLAVDAAGDISTVAVLPPSSFVATEASRRHSVCPRASSVTTSSPSPCRPTSSWATTAGSTSPRCRAAPRTRASVREAPCTA